MTYGRLSLTAVTGTLTMSVVLLAVGALVFGLELVRPPTVAVTGGGARRDSHWRRQGRRNVARHRFVVETNADELQLRRILIAADDLTFVLSTPSD